MQTRFARRGLLRLGLLGLGAAGLLAVAPRFALESAAPDNPISDENRRPGTTEWRLARPAMHGEIEGYAGATSARPGERLTLFARATDPTAEVRVYRMGWYGGQGGRLVATFTDVQVPEQPAPRVDPSTGYVSCGWHPTLDLPIGADWPEGVYLARLIGARGFDSYVHFVVRSDRPADLLFQCAVTTYQAYNNWGGWSLYDYNSKNTKPGIRVSFDRPYQAYLPYAGGHYLSGPTAPGAGHFLLFEYPMLRWLERHGYSLAYATSLDLDADPAVFDHRKVYLSVGHDEYWSDGMRQHLAAAESKGIGLGFFGGNTMYWRVRMEDGGRTMFCYKNREPGRSVADSTNAWRALGKAESEVVGVMYSGHGGTPFPLVFKDAAGPLFAGTGLRPGDALRGLVGYEWDSTWSVPRGATRFDILAESPVDPAQSYIWPNKAPISQAVTFVNASGARVFGAGTIFWAWGLDCPPGLQLPDRQDPRLQRLTQNLLAALSESSKNA